MANLLEEEHPELFHYTGISGLEGIIKSQTLWASHALFMNDTTELCEFKARFQEILKPVIEKFIVDKSQDPAIQSFIKERGGRKKFLESYIHSVSQLYDSNFFGVYGQPAHAEPFVVSFCTHDDNDIKQHGLLSQWRGYGQEGGYAVVFDTALLSKLLEQEARKFPPRYNLFGGKVIYSNELDDKVREELGKDFEIIMTSFQQYLEDKCGSTLYQIDTPLIRCACRFKHWGFHEEKEVRFIVIRRDEIIERHHFFRAGSLVPCIHLFDGITQLPDSPLPIKRIIVGPHRDKERRRRAIESLLRQYQLNIPVSVSQIPYVSNY